MLRITAIGIGKVDYLIRGSGCDEHEHKRTASPTLERDAGVQQDAADYFLTAASHGEAPGRWDGRGLAMLGVERIRPGAPIVEDDVRAIFGELQHPQTGAWLGRRPRSFKDHQQRVAAALAAEPGATPERRREIELQVRLDTRKAVAYYDFTFSPAKSVSVYYAALLLTGRTEQAATLLQSHRDAVDIAMNFAEQHCAYTRTGYHGATLNGRSVGRYEAATGLIMTMWDHSTNRELEPQLHTHVAVLDRVQTTSDGVIRALDGRGFRPIKEGVASAYERALVELASQRLPVRFALRPDGKAWEIMGVDPQLCEQASTRRSQIEIRTAEWAAAYTEQHGHPPNAGALKAIAQAATLETRKPKSTREGGPTAVIHWAEDGTRIEAMTALPERTERQAEHANPHLDLVAGVDQRDQAAIVRAAVEHVQNQYSTWTLGNLMAALDTLVLVSPGLPLDRPAYIESLARQALQPANPYGVLLLTAPDPAPVPVPLQRREDGRSIYRPHIDERYCTQEHLNTERRITSQARQLAAPTIDAAETELLRVELLARGLGPDQADAIAGVMSSGRAGDNLVGPAGAGKSTVLGVLTQVWADRFGGRVIGLATSQHATDILTKEGIHAVNTTVFLNRFTPNARGDAQDYISRGDLFVIDEASMSSTTEIARISDLVLAGHGKTLFTGDPAQLGAVGAGGLFDLLVRENGAYHLDHVHRFRNSWEGPASLRLRLGDTSVITEYEARARLVGGTEQELHAAAVRTYVADTLAGLHALLIVRSNADAADLSGQIRRQLVALGLVESEPIIKLSDGNLVSVGDLVQARRNDYTIDVEPEGMVVNRHVYRVQGLDQHGRLLAKGVEGAAVGLTVHLPTDYCAADLALAYACTQHSAQGSTVDTSQSLYDVYSTRNDLYTGATRGRLRNTIYLITHRAADHHDPDELQISPAEVMATILGNDGGDCAAELDYRQGQHHARSLAWIGGQWDDISREYSTYRYSDTLLALLGTAQMEALAAEPGYDRLMRTLRAAELDGHHIPALLHQTATLRELYTAQSVSDVLRFRVQVTLNDNNRIPERQIDPDDWTTYLPPLDGTVGGYLHELAVQATERQTELGYHAADQLPAWATERLGLPPTDPDQHTQHDEWVHRAGIAAAYRDLVNLPDEQLSLGPCPSRENVLQHKLWYQAHAALGYPTDTLDYHIATEGELRAMRSHYQRQQDWAPPYVANDMHTAYTLAASHQQDHALFTFHAATMPPDSPTHQQTLVEADQAARLALDYTERARQLEEIHQSRGRWLEATHDAQLRHQLAGEELERRGLPIDPEPSPPAQQIPLFELPHDHAADVAEQLRQDHALTAETHQVAAATAHTELVAVTEHDQQPEHEQQPVPTEHEQQQQLAQHETLFDLQPTTEERVQAQPLHHHDHAAAVAEQLTQDHARATEHEQQQQLAQHEELQPEQQQHRHNQPPNAGLTTEQHAAELTPEAAEPAQQPAPAKQAGADRETQPHTDHDRAIQNPLPEQQQKQHEQQEQQEQQADHATRNLLLEQQREQQRDENTQLHTTLAQARAHARAADQLRQQRLAAAAEAAAEVAQQQARADQAEIDRARRNHADLQAQYQAERARAIQQQQQLDHHHAITPHPTPGHN